MASTEAGAEEQYIEIMSESYVTPGMPPLEQGRKTVSFFEFWPTWLMYFPVVLQWLVLGVYYRSWTLPLLANPKLKLSGMVGIPKSHLLSQASGECQRCILPWFVYAVTEESLDLQTSKLDQQLSAEGFAYPVVCKPDIGCRGSGVKLIHDRQQLAEYIDAYPSKASIMVQKLASWEPEAGVFFVKHPHQPEGRIISLALKYSPYVVGDGVQTLRQLIASDARASELTHLYYERHQDQLDVVIEKDQPYKLVFSASHCRGAVFKNAAQLITPELTQRLNRIVDDLPEFYYGRMDIKFSNVESLARGEDLEIVEINTASSESLHIWDSGTGFGEAIRSLLFQYKTLFQLGAANRRRGFKTPRFSQLLEHWRIERQLTKYYPATD